MEFVPAPENTFLEFMREYHARCQKRAPKIRAVAAKWAFEDLIPGLSDFDTRFVVDDSMTPADWGAMSLAVGEVHTAMCREFPHWARNLEHLPGVNLTAAEVMDDRLFYPEFAQWTYYEGDAALIRKIEETLAGRVWSARDEHHHLKKFAIFYGPYVRGIDPPVNLGPWENKYPLHSRFMHYFSPPVQAAVSLVLNRNVRGKFEALHLARGMFEQPETIDRLFEATGRHYEIPGWYQEPALGDLERELEKYLAKVWAKLAGHVKLVEPKAGDDVAEVRRKIGAVGNDPVQAFFESAKFCRLLKGRLLFYSQNIPHFDSAWLIRNELGRAVGNFYTKPLTIYGKVKFGEELGPQEVLNRLEGSVLSAQQVAGMKRFAEVAGRKIAQGHEKEQAAKVADGFEVVPVVLGKLSEGLLSRE